VPHRTLDVENVVTRPDRDTLLLELATLYKQQYDSLQRDSYLRMTQAGQQAYDTRRVRIGLICELLSEANEIEGEPDARSDRT
jgi:hypothetical protein